MLPSGLEVSGGSVWMMLPFTSVDARVLPSITTVHDRFSHSQPVPTVALIGLRFLHFLGSGFELSPGSAPPISVSMVR